MLAEAERDQDRLLARHPEVAPLLALGGIDTLRSALISRALTPPSGARHCIAMRRPCELGWYLPLFQSLAEWTLSIEWLLRQMNGLLFTIPRSQMSYPIFHGYLTLG